MKEPVTISKAKPHSPSLDYELLRTEGLKYLQSLSHNVWTDFNYHDPGITFLEALSFCLTDLAFKANYPIEDVIASGEPLSEDQQDFFTARQILHNCALTVQDYRKLLIDIEGVRNAWITNSEYSEQDIFEWREEERLDYIPDPNVPIEDFDNRRVLPKMLYNIMLEFDRDTRWGDLNEHVLTRDLTVVNIPGFRAVITVAFPTWDKNEIDFNDLNSIRSGVLDLNINYSQDLRLTDNTTADNKLIISSLDKDEDAALDLDDIEIINEALEKLIYVDQDSMIIEYQTRILHIHSILEVVKYRLQANRNLGVDYFKYQSIQVEHIVVCGKIALRNDANVALVWANIIYRLEEYFSPTPRFWGFKELFDKELPVENIFEGPALANGFIRDKDLVDSELHVLRASDIVSMIMSIEGVQAVHDFQIGNKPEGAMANGIFERSVKWCLELHLSQQYLPRFSESDSNIVFFKDDLPFSPDPVAVQGALTALREKTRHPQVTPDQLDIPVPNGEYRDLNSYISLQEELPPVYGMGSEGLGPEANALRQAQAKQLKAYLTLYDQFMANYLEQLNHSRRLLSIDPEVTRTYFNKVLTSDEVPNIEKWEIYKDDPDGINDLQYVEDGLNELSEENPGFLERRNKFLDHLMARHGEQFTEYALLLNQVQGERANKEILEDKLNFMADLPALSAGRGKAFNYTDQCRLWHIDNVSGLERRVRLLTGIDPKDPSDLLFKSISFFFLPEGNPDHFAIKADPQAELRSVDRGLDLKEAAELALICAQFIENYEVDDEGFHINLVCSKQLSNCLPTENGSDNILARSTKSFGNSQEAQDALQGFFNQIRDFITKDFFQDDEDKYNHEANRKNLSCPIDNYLRYTINTTPGADPPSYKIVYRLYKVPFPANNQSIVDKKITGTITGFGESTDDTKQKLERIARARLFDVLKFGAEFENYMVEEESGELIFKIINDKCEEIGRGVETDLNQLLVDRIITAGEIIIFQPGTGQLSKTVNTVEVYSDKTEVKIILDDPIDLEGRAHITPSSEGFEIKRTDPNRIILTGDLTKQIVETDYITLTRPDHAPLDNRQLQVQSIELTGTADDPQTIIRVAQDLSVPADEEWQLLYKSYPLDHLIDDKTLVIKGREEILAIRQCIKFIREKFFRNEGMHLIEHVLLRPKYKDPFLEIGDHNELIDQPGENGKLKFCKQVKIAEISVSNGHILLDGDFTAEFIEGEEFTIINSVNQGTYTIEELVDLSGKTIITTSNLVQDTADSGQICYSKTADIVSVNHDLIIVQDRDVVDLRPGQVLEIVDSKDNVNDGKYSIYWVSDIGGDAQITIRGRQTILQDDFLPIETDVDCEQCYQNNPYSCIVSVILPYWPERFQNMEFRKFMEKTIRLEAPSHILLNICWIDCQQMEDFEKVSKAWLVENARSTKDPIELSNKLNDLIEVLSSLRNIYPPGRLHDCKTDVTQEDAVILDRTQLGTS